MRFRSQIYIICSAIALSFGLSGPAAALRLTEKQPSFAGKGTGEGRVGPLGGIAYDRRGNLYASDPINRRIQKYDPNGRFLLSIAPAEGSPFAFRELADIAVDPKGNIYVVDTTHARVAGTGEKGQLPVYQLGHCFHKFDPEGRHLATYTLLDLTEKPEDLSEAHPAVLDDNKPVLTVSSSDHERALAIAADEAENLFVIDSYFVYKLDPSGEVVLTFGQFGADEGDLDTAMDIACGPEGRVYIIDSRNHRVAAFGADGSFLHSIGGRGYRDGLFYQPFLLAVTDEGDLLVADNHFIQEDFLSFLPRRENDPTPAFLSESEEKEAFPYRKDRTYAGRVQIFDREGRYKDKILYRLDQADPVERDLALYAISPRGNLLLVDEENLTFHPLQSFVRRWRWKDTHKTLSFQGWLEQSTAAIDSPYDEPLTEDEADYMGEGVSGRTACLFALLYPLHDQAQVGSYVGIGYQETLSVDRYGASNDPFSVSLYGYDLSWTDTLFELFGSLFYERAIDPDPRRFRTFSTFASVYLFRALSLADGIDPDSLLAATYRQWGTILELHGSYDLGPRLSLQLTSHCLFPGVFFNYVYTNELGNVDATASYKGAALDIMLSLLAAF